MNMTNWVNAMDSRKIVFQETAVIALGVAICTAVMYGIYALLHLFSVKVLLGGVLGCVLSVGNFFFMAVGTSLAADRAQKQDVKGGQGIIQRSMLIRYIVLFVILFAAGKSGWFDLFALVLPLVFVRPVLTVAEFFRKSGDKKNG